MWSDDEGSTMLPFAQATDALDKLIDRDQDFRLLGTGFGCTEGPAWNTPGDYLVFSDIPGDRRWRWSEQRGMELVVRTRARYSCVHRPPCT